MATRSISRYTIPAWWKGVFILNRLNRGGAPLPVTARAYIGLIIANGLHVQLTTLYRATPALHHGCLAEAPRFERRLPARVGRISNPLEYLYPMPPLRKKLSSYLERGEEQVGANQRGKKQAKSLDVKNCISGKFFVSNTFKYIRKR